ncbi:MAG TPA: class I SAM-dependent methyltransferase [Steroidobacteraceae bacterium]|nr:class I SAM-dependent methyltransferase [Steroidobacteraceae bacterium]
MNWLRELSVAQIARKIATRILPNLHHLYRSRIRICGACQQVTVILVVGSEELDICVRCRANLRYEMLARRVRLFPLANCDVLELDPNSPLRPILGTAKSYARSFFRPGVELGSRRPDGAVCQDITRLTYPDSSLDLIVSSDVLEHVPHAHLAFRETARVLRPGGAHLFTVPPRERTRNREGLEPEYHADPLDPAGILVYWDYGPDLPSVLPTPGLELRIVAGPEGRDRRIVWEARKT